MMNTPTGHVGDRALGAIVPPDLRERIEEATRAARRIEAVACEFGDEFSTDIDEYLGAVSELADDDYLAAAELSGYNELHDVLTAAVGQLIRPVPPAGCVLGGGDA